MENKKARNSIVKAAREERELKRAISDGPAIVTASKTASPKKRGSLKKLSKKERSILESLTEEEKVDLARETEEDKQQLQKLNEAINSSVNENPALEDFGAIVKNIKDNKN